MIPELPSQLLLLLFGITNAESKAAEEIFENYKQNLETIIIKILTDYTQSNPTDEEFKKYLSQIISAMANGDEPVQIENYSEHIQEVIDTLTQEINKRTDNYNQVLIDSQLMVLSPMEHARIRDYLDNLDVDTSIILKTFIDEINQFYPKEGNVQSLPPNGQSSNPTTPVNLGGVNSTN